MELIEKERIKCRFKKAQDTYDAHAEAQRRICARLIDLLSQFSPSHFRRVLEIGCGSGTFTRLLQQRRAVDEWVLNDLCDSWEPAIRALFPTCPPHLLTGDAEALPFPGKFDLIASASAFQWMKDLPRFIHKLSGHLSPRGLLAFNTFTAENLWEIKSITGEGLTYPPASRLKEWLSADFHILHEEEQAIPLTFPDPIDVLRHLKYTGVTANASGPWTRGRQEAFRQEYRERFASPDHQVTLTYHPLYIIAIKKEDR